MEKVPNADDFLDNYNEEYCAGQVYGSFGYPRSEVTKAMIDFAEAHVKAALMQASNYGFLREDMFGPEDILNCYPIENIK